MGFFVDLHNRFVIDEKNAHEFESDYVNGEYRARGLIPRDYAKQPYGASTPYAIPMSIPKIPRVEWKDRIEQIYKDKALISTRRKKKGIGPYNQQTTNFCWGNCVLKAFEIQRVLQGEEHIPLSPASICALITNFRNVGGWPTKFLEMLVSTGALPQSVWAPNQIDNRLNTPANNAQRAPFKATQWWDIGPRDFDSVMTAVLLGIPVAVAYNWWSHAVLIEDPIIDKNGRFGFGELNSWGPWGENGDGTFVLMEGKGTPDEACCPTLALATAA